MNKKNRNIDYQAGCLNRRLSLLLLKQMRVLRKKMNLKKKPNQTTYFKNDKKFLAKHANEYGDYNDDFDGQYKIMNQSSLPFSTILANQVKITKIDKNIKNA